MFKALRAFIALAVASGVFAPVAHAVTNPPDLHVDMGGQSDTATTIQRNFPAPESALCLAGECAKPAATLLAAPRAANVAAQAAQIVCKGVTYNHPIPYDLNGDCVSDLLWMNDQTHQFGWWLMGSPYTLSGTQYISRSIGGTISVTPGYWIAASGDFNGDFKADLIWTSNNRDLYLWTSTGTGFSSQYVGTYPAGWKLVGAADIDGDGIDDLIWENDDACEYGYWLMNGNTIKGIKIISITCGFQIAFIDTAFDSPNKTTPAIYWVNVSNPNYTSTSLYRWLPQSDTLNSVLLGYTGGATIIGVQSPVMYSPLLILNQAGVPETCQDVQNQCYPNTAGISIPGPGQYSIVAAGHYSSPASQDLLWASTDGGLVVANYTLTGFYSGAAPYTFYNVAGFPTGWHIVRPGKQN